MRLEEAILHAQSVTDDVQEVLELLKAKEGEVPALLEVLLVVEPQMLLLKKIRRVVGLWSSLKKKKTIQTVRDGSKRLSASPKMTAQKGEDTLRPQPKGHGTRSQGASPKAPSLQANQPQAIEN